MARRRSAPTYLVKRRGKWHGRFRHVDSIGQVHWPCHISPAPLDYRRSLLWAQTWRAEWIHAHELELRCEDEERRRPPTLGELLDAYAADCQERGTRWDRECSRAKWIQATLGRETPYSDLTPARIASWRTALRSGRHLSPRSLNAYATLLQAALNLAVRSGAIPVNPIRHLGKLPELRGMPEALSLRQVHGLIGAIEEYEAAGATVPLRGIVLTCYYTLARTGNVLALRWEDVDLERGEITFPRTKTGRRIVVPIRAQLAAYLATLVPASGYLWPSPRTGKPYTDVARPWRSLIRLANARLGPSEQIPPAQRLYSLRHSGISHLLLAGVPPQVVAQLAGNSVAVIDRHYAHLHDDALHRALAMADASPILEPHVPGIFVPGGEHESTN